MMGCYNIRYLVIAVVVLCQCITWTSSRHHFSHINHLHPTRHRRQGAGLFLAGSYVLPGGEGSGAWGPWGEVSPCSRTCGGGVASQKRICLEVGSDGNPQCTGGDTKYFSCQTQDCPEGSPDFRAQQCAEHDRVPYNGAYYNWVPYTKGPHPCELNCMPRGGRFYHLYRKFVTDGTRCNEESFDVCVNGSCQPVGCDRMLGSNAVEDKCRVCRGNGTNCRSIKGQIDSQDLKEGYNDIVLIPKGATSIVISEVKPSNNYLALRSKEDGKYFLNGGYIIDFPRNMMIAGALWQYERTPQYTLAPDSLRSLGPTNQPLYLSILLLGENVGVDYEYSIPTALAPPPNQEYNWVHDAFTPCSATCGGGTQTRNVTCRSREELEEVDATLCDAGLKPLETVPCATQPCAARWVEGAWGPCSRPCGEGGTRSRQVHCEKIFTNGYPSVVDDKECFNILGEKPPLYQECNKGSSCPTWFTGPWKPCDKLCGEGKQTRQVVCHQRVNGKVEVFADDQCSEDRPADEQSCYLHPCEGVDWVVSEWSGCDSCLSIVRTRTVECATKERRVVNASLCNYHRAPVAEEPCDKTALPACTVQWYATQWSNCSVECGRGVQTRRVFCGKFDGSGVLRVDDTQCENDTRYNDTKPCEVPDSKCPAKWFAGPWSECTKECGGGEQFRRVMCLSGGTEAKNCDGEIVLESTQPCNVKPCDKDETIPVDSKSTPVMDDDYDDEDCVEEDEDYGEAGAEEETEVTSTTLDDMMQSDSPSTAFTDEGSGEWTSVSVSGSDITDETGSGDGSSSPDFSSSTDSTVTEETSSSSEAGSTVSSDVTGSTEQSGSTESATEISGATETTSEAADVSTTEAATSSEASTTNESSTEAVTTTEASETTTDASTTEIIETTTEIEETSTTESDVSSTTDAQTTTENEQTTTEANASSVSDASTTGDASTTESSDQSSTTDVSTAETGSTTESGSTETGATEESVTTETGATEITGSTEITSTDVTGTTETGITDSSTTEETGSIESSTTELSSSTDAGTETTPWDWASTIEVFTKKGRCKAHKKKAKCTNAKFGCCPDKRTPAAGPFDEGCPNPKTCKEAKHGCCPDGVSPAYGPNNKDCPLPPCNETLYGCCKSDKKTPAEGNDQEGCPPPPPKCKGSKFGCCKDGQTSARGPKGKGCPENAPKPKDCGSSEFGCCHDNKTVAPGPNGEGCPCDVTEHGCCPDGVSTAHGPQLEGCLLSCNTSAHGCCPDQETPAHGPDGEGCCLLSSFGCCPDNYKTADGPHLEGCGCQYAHFGCCPDNVTVAKGPNKEGCGCQFTEHGCCPDRHTAASGPSYEGCSCHTYQFGCCPDGSTVAKGPNQQGCHCSQSPHGCCGDGVTAAQGPAGAGCSCAASAHGCCPDGVSSAQGDDFLGCADKISDPHEACGLPLDHGPCRNYTVRWYYDVEYGGCARFWYGDCGGNGNRFSSQAECEDVCVHPEPKHACALPRVKGACAGYFPRWHYDAARGACSQFVYGGCLGNANNFDSRDLCRARCEPDTVTDQCKLPIERGSCAGNFTRWGFNPAVGRCEQFAWGGCEGNGNRFASEAACVNRCDPPGALKPTCTEPTSVGNCTDKHARWTFSPTENRCVPFYYTGCNGNGNNYQTEQECTDACPSPYVKETCVLPAEVGDCADYRERWYYDSAQQSCRQFYYGGCGGNNNNFVTERECEERCGQQVAPTTTARPTQPPQVFDGDFCHLDQDPGPCTVFETRWSFDRSENKCTQFQYGGCGGNRNNFPSQEYCDYYCKPQQDICQLPMSSGPCEESLMRWFYDAATDTCSQFTYGGCRGNDNRFDTRADCEQRCRGAPRTNVATVATPVVDPRINEASEEDDVPPECQVSQGLEPCSDTRRVWYLDAGSRECVAHDNSPAGCRVQGAFDTEEGCERACASFRGLDVCRYPVDPGPCNNQVVKIYFDVASGQCQQYHYGGCHGGPNRFSTLEECRQTCVPDTADPCSLSPEKGRCRGYMPSWFYDRSRDECVQFIYGGCNGNANRFESREACEGRCRSRPASPPSTARSEPAQQGDAECITPESLTPCGENVTSFYYDSSRGLCLWAPIGDCRYPNSYRTEEECERRCGAFKDLDVCRAGVDPGPCTSSVAKFYFDAALGRCQPFAYGGCHGGPNRFSTLDECEELCAQIPQEGGNEVVPECSPEDAATCATLSCAWGVQRVRDARGCERCACVQEAVACDVLRADCQALKCAYGLRREQAQDGCERCTCIEHPCAGKVCPAGQRCVAEAYRDPDTQDVKYNSTCRTMVKSGSCPSEEVSDAGEAMRAALQCRRECNDDADCRERAHKCCARGCSQLCLPAASERAPPFATRAPTTPHVPELPQAPRANVDQTEPEVMSSEGSKATLRCLFHGNPPPTITWRRGELTIDGTVGRYRIASDGALEIVSLFRNDSGVYICIADNALGTARQEVNLQVNDPVEEGAGIAGDEDATVTGELGQSLAVRCLAYGFPAPEVAWYRGRTGPMVPYSSDRYEARGNVLLIRALAPDTLGEYACNAYNGVGKPAQWSVRVQAWRRPGDAPGRFLVDRDQGGRGDIPAPPPTQPAPAPTQPATERAVFTIPVITRLSWGGRALAAGGELSLPCEVDGYPTPAVSWTKDGAPLLRSDRVQYSDARLTISRLTPEDSGVYGCHASNEYSAHNSTVQITVEGAYVPATCTDNPLFANCKLIVTSKFCDHKYYSRLCCKSCLLAGELRLEQVQAKSFQFYKK